MTGYGDDLDARKLYQQTPSFLVLDSLGETLASLKWAIAVSPYSLGLSTLQVIKRTP